MTFRVATADDFEALIALINAAYRGDTARSGWTHESDLLGGVRTDEENVRELAKQPKSKFLVGFEGNELIASVYLEEKPAGVCYLGMLTVKPTRQAGGFGRILLREAENFARKNFKSKTIEMTVITLRHELIDWYVRRGYRRTGRIVPFPVHPKYGQLKVEHLEMEVLDKSLS